MRLDLGDEVFSEQASEQDIAAALAKVPRDDHWSLLLEAGNDFLLADAGQDQGSFELHCSRGDEALRARARLDDAQLQTLFSSFLNRDDRWRSACKWRSAGSDAPEDEAQYSASTNRAAGIFGAGFVALLFLVAIFPDHWLPGWLPPSLQSSGGWLVVLFVLAMPGVLVAAMLVKLREVRKASTWPKTIGKIVSCELVVARRRVSGEASRAVNRPAVRYSYQANGQRFTGSRISIGEIADNDPRIPEILRRYAVGSNVPVYYQPDKPANSVLERDPPVGLHLIWGVAGGIFLIIAAVAGWFLFPEWMSDWLAPYLPQVRHPYLLIFFSAMALLALLRMLSTRLRPAATAGWASTPGTILVSEIEAQATGRKKTSHAHIEYRYAVDGQEYSGSRIHANVTISGSAWIVRKLIEKYPVGQAVSVHYNKENPAEAALERASSAMGGGLTAVAICGFLAWYFATH